MENMVAKMVIVILIISVIFFLFRALYLMISNKDKSKDRAGVANFLTLRVIFSALLIAFLILSNYMGWVEFHGPYQDPRQIEQMKRQHYLQQQENADVMGSEK
ncbi:MAG TPA: hypothetical protein DCS49_06010 [Gammaproteobacteria bacterium]|nr:hypothetical protein [Gammaproteobacteria bacterium]